MRTSHLLAAAVVVLAACSESDQTPTAPSSTPSLATGDNGLRGKPEPKVHLAARLRSPSERRRLTQSRQPRRSGAPASQSKAIFWGSNWNNASFAGDKMTGLATFFGGFGGATSRAPIQSTATSPSPCRMSAG